MRNRMFTLLQTCKGLRRLDIKIGNYHGRSDIGPFITHFSTVKGFMATLHNATDFTFSIDRSSCGPSFENSAPPLSEDQEKEFCHSLAAYYRQQLPLSVVPLVNLTILRSIYENVNLNIHGGGRLGTDKRPDIIASRTRQGVRRVQDITPEGTYATVVEPKYNVEGYLNWNIEEIMASREVCLTSRELSL